MTGDAVVPDPPARAPERPDLRLPVLGLAGWSGGLLALVLPGVLLGLAFLLLGAFLVAGHRRLSTRTTCTLAGAILVCGSVAGSSALRQAQARTNPVAGLAGERAVVSVVVEVTSDPRRVIGQYGARVLVRGHAIEVTGRGRTHELRAPVLLMADSGMADGAAGERGWEEVPLGSRVRTVARLAPTDDSGLAALVVPRGPPQLVAGPDAWWRAAAAVRASIRESVAHRPPSQRAIVPALVDGDEAGLDPALADDFRTTGLTHLLAVSGTNLTLVVGFLLVSARWCGVRGRWLYAVGGAGIVGFVLLARTEPSVVRAAAMGTVALLAMGTDGRQRGGRALGAAVVGLLLVDPGLAGSVGFALSVLATAGILFLAPGWRDALARWMPRWAAEAIAVPATAQLACTPVVAAISGQVSLVAVLANLVVAPVVGPATVLGLAGGLLGLVWSTGARAVGSAAAWCVAWIVEVARRGSQLPTPSVEWGTNPLSLVLLTALSLTIALVGPRVVGTRSGGVTCCLVLALSLVARAPTPGWPPDRWLVAACDVGQGDALAVRAGPASAVVVDAGPDPAAVDRCLDRLDVSHVPLVLLTHFHADHVDGLTGVLEGRQVDAVEVTPIAQPAAGASEVTAVAAGRGLVPQVATFDGVRRIGTVTLQVLWPPPRVPLGGAGGSTANDGSIVLLAEAGGVRLLLTGDVEPPAQAALARTWPGLEADVLKVPHHGSRHQDLDFLLGLGARIALVSSGEGNPYGHPAPETLRALEAAGVRVLRTDVEGDALVVVDDDGALTTATTG